MNELTNNTNGGTLTVVGTTTSPATSVSVNGTAASLYGDSTFAAAGLPLTTTYTATAADSLGRHSTNAVSVSLSTNVSFEYDGNGNLTNDGLRNFAYDDENELIQVSVSNAWMSQFSYDGKMRRRIRKEFTWQSSGWVQTNQVNYIYDGNLVIQERNLNSLPTTTYTRGKDLSGSLEGAGGIGGLLSMTLNTGPGQPSSNSMCYHSDGNGNVTMLINLSQSIVAKYLYDAFGNILSMSGSMAAVNPYCGSSKERHQNSGLVYYLYRYYDPNLQRWPNRDPIGEEGGLNLYGFVANDPLTQLDSLGLLIAGGGVPSSGLIEHESTLRFTVTCPSCSQFVWEYVDYSGAVPALENLDGKKYIDNIAGPIPPAAGLGGLKDIQNVNCAHQPTTVDVYMKTRLAAIGWPVLFGNGLTAGAAANAYAAGTVIHYHCLPCAAPSTPTPNNPPVFPPNIPPLNPGVPEQ